MSRLAVALLAVAVAAPALLVAPAPCWAGEVAPATSPAGPLLDRLDAESKKVNTIAAEFTQTSRIKLFKQAVTSKGRMFFERPRRVRWEYFAPDASVMVLDGDRATLTTPGAKPQVFDLTRDATMRAIFDQLLLWLGSGSVRTAEADYDIGAAGTPAAPLLVLTPKATSPVAKAVSRVELRLDKDLVLRGILLREASGDEKEITFTRVDRNKKLPADTFKP